MNKEEQQFLINMARTDLLSFCILMDKYFDVIKIHEEMGEALQKVLTWETKNLILQLPPRSGKSRIMQEFVAYTLWNYPNKDILLTGHSSSLLESFSRNIQNRINSDIYKEVFDTRITDGNSAVKSWKVKNGWEFSIYGVGWGITGKGWHILIIDDPYAWREDAESETIRTKVWDWYKSTFLSRKQNKDSAVIIIMQRWREDDLVWQLLEEQWDKWEVVKFPAINEQWESFWPQKFPIEYLEEIRQDMWEYFFQSQYQQDPINIWSGDFKPSYFQYYEDYQLEEIKHRLDVVTFLDPAISKTQEADNTALITIWVDKQTNFTYILDITKLKEYPDIIIDELFNIVNTFKDFWLSYKAGIEIVQYQKMLALEIKKQMMLRDNPFILQELRPTGEKEARIRTTLQPRYSNSWIFHKKWWKNVQDLETELLKFPKGRHDDMIDALASAIAISKTQNINKKQSIAVPSYI